MSEQVDRGPLLVIDRAPTAVSLVGAIAVVCLWAFATLNGPTDERSRRNEKDISTANKKFDEIHRILLEISSKVGQ